ncbi:ABC transporter ATP-binding protein [Nocardia thailandica]
MSVDTIDELPEKDTAASRPETAAGWRGIAKEDDAVTDTGNVVLAARSRKLLKELLRPYRGLAALTAALIVIDSLAKMTLPLFVAAALDHGVTAGARGDWGPLARIIAGFLAVTLFSGVTTFLFMRLAGRLSQRVLYDLRARVFTHSQRLSVSFHERYTSGKVVTRLTSDIEALQEFLDGALNLAFGAIISVVAISVVLVWLDPAMAAIVLAGFVPLFLVTRWAQRRQRAGYRRTRGAVARVVVHFVEAMSGMRAVQTFRREHRNDAVLAGEDGEYRTANATAIRGIGEYIGLSSAIGSVSLVLVLLAGAWQVIEGRMAIGVLAAFLLYLNQFYSPLDELAQVFNSYQSAAAALEKISGVLEEDPEVAEPDAPAELAPAAGEVRLRRVWFGYDPAEPVLHELDLDIPAGQVVALVGATGAGKSTLVKLITRFYDPSGGVVTLDGVDLARIADADLRRRVVMVTQEAYLFSGSIADNIRLGKPDATDAEVRAAARAVGLHDFVTSLPEGFATDVHKRGGRLSAGQRQLVSFARVFLADPAVIVLDEATSSLDIPSERLVQRALETLLHGRTAVIIAHRLSTVSIADRVLVLEAGRIVEDGAPDVLAAGTGRYAGLHAAWRDSLV